MICRKNPNLPRTVVSALFHAFLKIIWHGNRLSRGLQGISARAVICRKNPNLPRTAVSALFHAFLKIIWQGNRLSRGLQGTSARAMASICVHRAPRTPPDSAPRHTRSRGDLQEEPQPATHSRQCPIPRFPAIHLARQTPFYVPAGHISSRDGLQEARCIKYPDLTYMAAKGPTPAFLQSFRALASRSSPSRFCA